MKSFLNFPDLTGLQNSSILAENTSDHDIDDEDKIKQQKSLDEIADLLTSSNEQEIAQGFDLITQSIPSGNYHHQNLGKIFYLHQLQEKLVEKNPSFLRNKQLNDDFKLKELSEELTLIIDHSSLKSKDEVFFQVTIFFHNIFNILCFFYNTKNHQLENVLNFDSEYPNSIKKLMDFHFKLFSIFETKPLPVDDFKKLINQNFELFLRADVILSKELQHTLQIKESERKCFRERNILFLIYFYITVYFTEYSILFHNIFFYLNFIQ
jgi:predicted house-cleaning noncanonical NTP pyrophosphatase (MazG superfamily)